MVLTVAQARGGESQPHHTGAPESQIGDEGENCFRSNRRPGIWHDLGVEERENLSVVLSLCLGQTPGWMDGCTDYWTDMKFRTANTEKRMSLILNILSLRDPRNS